MRTDTGRKALRTVVWKGAVRRVEVPIWYEEGKCFTLIEDAYRRLEEE